MSEPVPSVAELSALLKRYFVDADDRTAQRLHDDVRTVLSDPARYAGEIGAFDPGNDGRKTFGQAWREELAFEHRSPIPMELAAWLAATGDNYPEPRPYCPGAFVGSWQQYAPGGVLRWQFVADGTFVCDDPMLRSRIRWCLHRQSATGPVGDVLWLDDELGIAHKYVMILAATTTELHLRLPGTRTEYKLVRV